MVNREDHLAGVKSAEELFCPFMSSGSIPVNCDSKNCALFVERKGLIDHRMRWRGCALRWLGVQSAFE